LVSAIAIIVSQLFDTELVTAKFAVFDDLLSKTKDRPTRCLPMFDYQMQSANRTFAWAKI